MQICSNGHEEVVFEDRIPCPLCEASDKINLLEDEIEELEEKLWKETTE